MTTAAIPRTGRTTRSFAGAGASPVVVAAEIGLLGLSVAVVVGFRRVFVDWGFLVPLASVAIATHIGALLCRRRGLSVPASAGILLLGLPFVVTPTLFWSTGIAGVVPTGATLDAAREALRASWQTFQTVSAPAPVEPGFVLAAALAVFFAAFLADWAAFRLWSPAEAAVPASTLFVFCSLLGSTEFQLPAAGFFLGGLLTFVLLHRATRLQHHAGWLGAEAARGSRAITGSGTLLVAGALAAALLVGPHLPGAGDPAVLSLRGSTKTPGSRVTVSPLVDIQDRLVEQADVEVFTVDANARSYWRMTALDTFEGDIWKSGGKYGVADGDLGTSLPQGVQGLPVDQTYRISALKVLWMPAAYQPTSLDAPDVDVRYQAESSTLIVDTNRNDSDNMTYRVQSVIPTFTADQLRGASADVPSEISSRYLQLPSDFSAVARRTAQQATAGAATPYDKARALQDFFRDGSFTYDLEVPKGHGDSAIESFLQNRRGYCEQFAGSYAAMARSIGLPARVAVGFTPGDPDPTNPSRFRVRGEHAHAWPEVWLTGFGWVPFEPTPDRGAPNAQDWTGVPEEQVASSPTTAPPTSAAAAPSTSIAPSPDQSTPQVTPPPQVVTGGGDGELEEGLGFAARSALIGTALLLLAAVYAAVVLWLGARRVRRRRERANDASARVRVAWEESVEALALAGTPPWASETHREYAARAADALPTGAAPLLVGLAEDVDAAAYAPGLLDETTADRADRTSSALVASVLEGTPPARRWRYRLDPRPLLPRWTSRHRATSSRD